MVTRYVARYPSDKPGSPAGIRKTNSADLPEATQSEVQQYKFVAVVAKARRRTWWWQSLYRAGAISGHTAETMPAVSQFEQVARALSSNQEVSTIRISQFIHDSMLCATTDRPQNRFCRSRSNIRAMGRRIW